MDWVQVKSNWPAFLGPITQRWPETNEAELMDVDGDRQRFEAYLAQATGQDIQDARDQIARWLDGEMPADVRMDDTRDNLQIRDSARHIPTGEDVYSEDREFGDDDLPAQPIERRD